MTLATASCDPKHYRYTLASVDPTKVSFDLGAGSETLLRYNGKVLTVTFVARIVSTFFQYGKDQSAPKCSSVKFKFLRPIDDLRARELTYQKASPPKGEPYPHPVVRKRYRLLMLA